MNTLLKSTLGTIAVLAALSVPAMAGDLSEVFGKSSSPKKAFGTGPAATYTNQHWISPQGCSYSRAEAPGYAPTWHLILNGSHVGLTDAKAKCPIMMTTPDARGWWDN